MSDSGRHDADRFVASDERSDRDGGQTTESATATSAVAPAGAIVVASEGASSPGATESTAAQAAVALILSILGLVVTPAAIGGVILGHRTRRRIADSGGTSSGRGTATAAIVVGWCAIVGTTLLYVALLLALASGFSEG